MLVKRTTLPRGVVVIVIGILCTNTLAQCPPWGYDDSLPNGPSHWGDLCPQYASCKLGQGQSPIDLRNEQVLGVSGQSKDLEYSYEQVKNITVINKHHTIEGMDLGEGNTLSFVGLHNYTLSEFHFHAPSEHRINGVQYPLEIHYLHTDPQGDRAVLSLLFESNSTAETTWFMSFMATILNDVPEDGNTTTVASLDIGSQIDVDKGFYHYEGSSTTPPCAGEVLWFVASSPVPIDPDTLAKFTTALKNNSRPIQSLNGRVVAHYLPNAPNGMKKVIYAIMFAALGLLLVFVILGIARYIYRIQTAKKYQNVQELVGFLGSTNNETL